MTSTNSAIEPRLIDCHAHVFTLDQPLAENAWRRPKADATLELFLKTMEQAGVRYAALAAASLHGANNHYLLAATRRHPNLRTTVILDPRTEMSELVALNAAGVVGVRFQWRNVQNPPDLNAPDYQTFLGRIGDLRWHVELHDDARRLPPAIAAVQALGVNLVIDHFGRPDEAGLGGEGFKAVLRAIKRPGTWVKLSAAFRLASPALAAEAAAALLDAGGPERLLWGSDWPFVAFEDAVSYEQTLTAFLDWVPDSATRRAIDRAGMRLYFGLETP